MSNSMLQSSIDWFKGKTAIVTGASSGIGRSIAIELGRCGTKVAVHYCGKEREAHAVCDEIGRAGGNALPVQADLAEPAEVEGAFDRVASAFGERLDMLVNNAGQWMDKKPIIDCSIEQWDRMFAVNCRSVFLCCQQAARRMTPARSGAIVNIGSVAGHTGGGGGTVPYAAAKAAVHTFTRGFAREMAPLGIRVNGVAPGMVNTPMLENRVSAQALQQLSAATPLGRFSEPGEIVPAVLFLLSPGAGFITGEIIEVNGGLLMH